MTSTSPNSLLFPCKFQNEPAMNNEQIPNSLHNNQLSTIDTGSEPSTIHKSSHKNLDMPLQITNSNKQLNQHKVKDIHKEQQNNNSLPLNKNTNKIKLKKRNTNVLNLDIINHNYSKTKRYGENPLRKYDNKQIYNEDDVECKSNKKVYTLENEKSSNKKKDNDDIMIMNCCSPDMKSSNRKTEPNKSTSSSKRKMSSNRKRRNASKESGNLDGNTNNSNSNGSEMKKKLAFLLSSNKAEGNCTSDDNSNNKNKNGNEGCDLEKNLDKLFFKKLQLNDESNNNNNENNNDNIENPVCNESVTHTQDEMLKNFNLMKMRHKECIEKKQNIVSNTKKNVIALFYNNKFLNNNTSNDLTASSQINFEISSSDSNEEEDKLIFSQIHKYVDEQQIKADPLQVSKEICFDVVSPVVSVNPTASNVPPLTNTTTTVSKLSSHIKTASHIPMLKFKKLNTNTTVSSKKRNTSNINTTSLNRKECNINHNTNRHMFSNSLHKSTNFANTNLLISQQKIKSKSLSRSKHNKSKHSHSLHKQNTPVSSSFIASTSSCNNTHTNTKAIPNKESPNLFTNQHNKLANTLKFDKQFITNKLLAQLNSTSTLNKKSKSFRFFTSQQRKPNKAKTILLLQKLHYFRIAEREDALQLISNSNHSYFILYISYEYNAFYFVGLYYIDRKNEMLFKLTSKNKYAIPVKIKFQNIKKCFICKEGNLSNLITINIHSYNEDEAIVFFKKNLNFN